VVAEAPTPRLGRLELFVIAVQGALAATLAAPLLALAAEVFGPRVGLDRPALLTSGLVALALAAAAGVQVVRRLRSGLPRRLLLDASERAYAVGAAVAVGTALGAATTGWGAARAAADATPFERLAPFLGGGFAGGLLAAAGAGRLVLRPGRRLRLRSGDGGLRAGLRTWVRGLALTLFFAPVGVLASVVVLVALPDALGLALAAGLLLGAEAFVFRNVAYVEAIQLAPAVGPRQDAPQDSGASG